MHGAGRGQRQGQGQGQGRAGAAPRACRSGRQGAGRGTACESTRVFRLEWLHALLSGEAQPAWWLQHGSATELRSRPGCSSACAADEPPLPSPPPPGPPHLPSPLRARVMHAHAAQATPAASPAAAPMQWPPQEQPPGPATTHLPRARLGLGCLGRAKPLRWPHHPPEAAVQPWARIPPGGPQSHCAKGRHECCWAGRCLPQLPHELRAAAPLPPCNPRHLAAAAAAAAGVAAVGCRRRWPLVCTLVACWAQPRPKDRAAGCAMGPRARLQGPLCALRPGPWARWAGRAETAWGQGGRDAPVRRAVWTLRRRRPAAWSCPPRSCWLWRCLSGTTRGRLACCSPAHKQMCRCERACAGGMCVHPSSRCKVQNVWYASHVLQAHLLRALSP